MFVLIPRRRYANLKRMKNTPGIGIILAAGLSSRMGSPKALMRWNGRTFMGGIAEDMRAAGIEEVRVVTGRWADTASLPPLPVTWLQNRDAAGGPISSLRIALRDVPQETVFAVVALVDHPAVVPDTYRMLVQLGRHRPGEAIVPVFAGRGGHPVLLPREMFDLLRDPSVENLRDALARFPRERVYRWSCPDPGVLVDIDTPNDLERVKNRLADFATTESIVDEWTSHKTSSS